MAKSNRPANDFRNVSALSHKVNQNSIDRDFVIVLKLGSDYFSQAVMECIRVSEEDLRKESSSTARPDVDKSAGGSF